MMSSTFFDISASLLRYQKNFDKAILTENNMLAIEKITFCTCNEKL